MYKKEEVEKMDNLRIVVWQQIGRYEFEIVKTDIVEKYTGRIRIAESK
jgi:hypothetical protein